MVLFYGMKDLLVPIDQAGRIVIPKHVRQELAIKPGDLFKVAVRGAEVTLIPKRETAGFIRKGKALIFRTGGAETLATETVNQLLDTSREGQLTAITTRLPR
jgi:AbrB family looped-hinge helix DNA binding protein